MDKQYNFSYDWNGKLSNKAFTTLRLSDKFDVGDEIYVSLKNKRLPDKYLVKDRKAIKLESINEFVAYLDMGYSAEECRDVLRKMYSKKNINWETQTIFLYLLVKIKM